MNTTEPSLAQQREALRRQLLAQRLLITQQLGPEGFVSSTYPRSLTMQFISRRPALVIKLVMALVTWLKLR